MTDSESDKRRWLNTHRSQVEQRRQDAVAVESRWSWGRLLTFLAAASVWYPLIWSPVLALAAPLAALIAFVLAVRRHLSAKREREALDRLLAVIDEALQRCDGQVVCVRSNDRPADVRDRRDELAPIFDAGPVWELSRQERDDLDLYSPPVGVFGLLNRASTELGARRLRDWLEHPCLSTEAIRDRQRAVGWLADHPEQRLRLLAAAAALRREDDYVAALLRAVRDARAPASRATLAAMRWWSPLSGLFAVTAIVQGILDATGWFWALLALLAFNAIVFQRIRKSLSAALRPWWNVSRATDGYVALARQATADLPDEPLLRALRDCFAAVARRDVLPSLGRRVGWSESGGLMNELFNALVFFDVHVITVIHKCVMPHRTELLRGLSAIGDLEALLSLACFGSEQPVACVPEITDASDLHIRGGRHLLIPPDRSVANDIGLSRETRVWIVTGSNMAGKSTLLRVAGLSVVLAQVGGAVPAEQMRWSPLRLITDLRAQDSLARSESYFLAEVRQLRRMILPPPGDVPVLGLIDEPFRGTNSYEQIAASLGVVRHLIASGHLFLVATHERRLTTLADGTAAQNHHFRENLSADGLVFDYRLHPGPAQTRNALLILEREGYPPSILEVAHDLAPESLEP